MVADDRGDPYRETVHLTVTRWAHELPTATALIEGESRVSYARLDEWSDTIAAELLAEGVGPEATVAVRMPRCASQVASILGIWKVGAACVPLDPLVPLAQVEAALRAVDAAVLIDGDAGRHRLDGWRGAAGTGRNAGSRTAYVFFTSGSSGRPKAVAIPHAGIVNEARWTRDAFQLSPNDRGTWLSSPGFAISRWELWSHLTSGASVTLAADGLEWDADAVHRWLIESAATTTILVTALGEKLLAAEWPTRSALRLMVIGGEQLRHWPERLPFTVVNSYGATETSGVRLTARLADRPGDNSLPPLGDPIANTEAYVLDETGSPAPKGVTGELHIGGLGLAHGYLGNAALTADRFVPDPFLGAGARMYRTGDLVQRTAEGSLVFVGRRDSDAKVSGTLVDLAAIEAVLLRHPGVTAAAAAVHNGRFGHREVVAYVVPKDGELPAPHEMRSLAATALPRFMVPTRFVGLGELPRLINGKLDRSALPDPTTAAQLFDPDRTPADGLERAVVEAFEASLGVPSIRMLDDFFAQGGDSLSLAGVKRALERRFRVVLPVADLFMARTPAGVAELVRKQIANAQPSAVEADTNARLGWATELSDAEFTEVMTLLDSRSGGEELN